MTREELITHLQKLLQTMQEAESTYRDALEWDAIPADPTGYEIEETDSSVLYKYDEVTGDYHGVSDNLSNQILQYVVEHWDTVRPEVYESLRRTWQDAVDAYHTGLEELCTMVHKGDIL